MAMFLGGARPPLLKSWGGLGPPGSYSPAYVTSGVLSKKLTNTCLFPPNTHCDIHTYIHIYIYIVRATMGVRWE